MLRSAREGQYALVIDARSQREYADDHLLGAINLPVVNNEEYAQVGTMHPADAHHTYLIGVSYALKNIPHAIDDLVARYPKDARMLVYCFRGSKRSKLWFDALSTIGYRVDRPPGGWKAYRAWVREELASLPGRFRYHVLCGPTGCGKTRLLAALAAVGAQVLDLEELAGHTLLWAKSARLPLDSAKLETYLKALMARQAVTRARERAGGTLSAMQDHT